MILDRKTILAFTPELSSEEVTIPEWGGSVWVRTLTAAERDAMEAQWAETKNLHFRARFVKFTACDKDGRPLFLDEDIPILSRKPAPVIDRIVEVAQRLNKISTKDREAFEKNSENAPPADSSSA
jgi:hypothetical protein